MNSNPILDLLVDQLRQPEHQNPLFTDDTVDGKHAAPVDRWLIP